MRYVGDLGNINGVGKFGLWDLKIVIKIGTLGFKRSELKRRGEWGKDTELWVEPDTTKVEFYNMGKTGGTLISSISLNTLQPKTGHKK